MIACLKTDREDGLYTTVVCDEHGVALGLVYSTLVGTDTAADLALDGLLLAVVFVLCNDFVFGPRLTAAKRYVLCP